MEGCRGSEALDIPPTGLSAPFLIYPPTRAQWGARAGGLWGGFPNPAKLICMGFAKNGLTSSQPHTKVPRTPQGEGGPRKPWAGPWRPAGAFCTVPGRPGCSGCSGFSLLIYPPTRAQWSSRPGGLWGGFPNPAKLICMGFAKNGLTSSQPRRYVTRASAKAPGSGTSQPAYPAPLLPDGLPCTSPTTYQLAYPTPLLPSRLPCTSQPAYPAPHHLSRLIPNRLPCTAPTTYLPARLPCTHRTTYRTTYPAPLPPPTSQPTYPAPLPPHTKSPTLHLSYQPTYPAPPNSPTLYRTHYIPARLPCTSPTTYLPTSLPCTSRPTSLQRGRDP